MRIMIVYLFELQGGAQDGRSRLTEFLKLQIEGVKRVYQRVRNRYKGMKEQGKYSGNWKEYLR